MGIRIFEAVAVLSLAAAPLVAGPAFAQAGEVEFHIEASASVLPDRAVVPLMLTSSADTEAEAKAELDSAEKSAREKLGRIGIGRGQITVTPGPRAAGDGEVKLMTTRSGCAAAAVADADPAEAAGAAAVSAAAAGDAAYAAAQFAAGDGAAAIECETTYFAGRRTLTVELVDISKLEQVIAIASPDGYSANKPVFSQSDPASARNKARADAVAKARQDAEALAGTMGYRITGIKRVSNAKPGLSLGGLIEFIATVDNRGPMSQPSWFAGTVTESVMIDFAAVPK
jgi:uncharacterized protein YggE